MLADFYTRDFGSQRAMRHSVPSFQSGMTALEFDSSAFLKCPTSEIPGFQTLTTRIKVEMKKVNQPAERKMNVVFKVRGARSRQRA